jgi:hypothetical protein
LKNPFFKGGNHIYIFSGGHLVTFCQKKKGAKRTATTAKGGFLLGCYRPPGKTRLEVPPPLGDISCPSKAIKLTGTRNIFCPRVY